MKQLLLVLLCCVLLFSLTACGNGGASNEGAPFPTESEPSDDHSETALESQESDLVARELVVYFSATGNTKAVAETLAKLRGADIYEIVPEQPYTDEDLNYSDRSTRATAEQNDETARPAISGGVDSMEDYDVIYVGFPIWWGDMPRILNTFFDTYDLSGKTVAPFCTSGISGSLPGIRQLCPNSIVTAGLSGTASITETEIQAWLDDFIKEDEQ